MKLAPIALSIVLLAGCAHTPLQKVEDVRATYVVALHEINTLHNANLISTADKQKLAPTTQAVANALDAAEAVAANGGDSTATQQALNTANVLLDQLLAAANIDPKTLKKR